MLDHALEFAYVPGPIIANQAQKSFGRNVSNSFVVLTVEALKKAYGNEEHIIQALAQRRYLDPQRANTEVKVFPQNAFFQQRLCVAVRG